MICFYLFMQWGWLANLILRSFPWSYCKGRKWFTAGVGRVRTWLPCPCCSHFLALAEAPRRLASRGQSLVVPSVWDSANATSLSNPVCLSCCSISMKTYTKLGRKPSSVGLPPWCREPGRQCCSRVLRPTPVTQHQKAEGTDGDPETVPVWLALSVSARASWGHGLGR